MIGLGSYYSFINDGYRRMRRTDVVLDNMIYFSKGWVLPTYTLTVGYDVYFVPDILLGEES